MSGLHDRLRHSLQSVRHHPLTDHDQTDGHDRQRRRRRLLLIIAAVIVLVLVVWWLVPFGSSDEQASQPAPTVTVTEAKQQTWTEELTAVGTLEAVQGVDVTTELGGIVSAIDFDNGARVEAGAPLLRLDTSTEEAQLAALQAQREQARLEYERQQRLIEREATSEAEVETARAEFEGLAAQAQQIEATIEKKIIEAPFAGTLGIRQVSLGEYVAAGTAVVALQQISPIYVNFELPERTFRRVRTGLDVQVQTDSTGGETFTGRINAISPEIAQETRSFTVQALMPNEDRSLRPGMFADIVISLPEERDVIAVPTNAITRNAYGTAVYVVERQTADDARERSNENDTERSASEDTGQGDEGRDDEGEGTSREQTGLIAKSVFVETGGERGLLTEITQGLTAGQRVVTSGQLKLDDGVAVRIAEDATRQDASPIPGAP